MAIAGGRAPLTSENFRYFLTKPYELVWPPSPEQMMQVDQMLTELYDAGRVMLTSLEEGEVIDPVTGEASLQLGTGDILLETIDFNADEVEDFNLDLTVVMTAKGAGIATIPVHRAMAFDITSAASANITLDIRAADSSALTMANVTTLHLAGATGPRIHIAGNLEDVADETTANDAWETVSGSASPGGMTLENNILRSVIVYYQFEVPY